MLHGTGGTPGTRVYMTDGGKATVCSLKAAKEEEQQAENLYLFCSLSSCTVLPWSSSCARVPVLEGTCSEEEVYLQKTPNPNGMEEESKANLNTTCPHLPKNKAEGEVSRLWTVSKAAVG